MHCLIWFIATAALLGDAAAAGIRPIITITRTDPPARHGYQEQDTARAFYSYGYSDENAARAEYTTLDGTSRGFYAYVDANGKLQTVKYEAGGQQGFKAEASNQPKAPVDDNKPVEDTAEVQQARQAHLSALKEAQEAQELQQELPKENDTQKLSDEDAEILERVRAELTSMLAQRQREESQDPKESATQSGEAADQEQEQPEEQPPARQEQRLHADKKNHNNQRLRTVYSLDGISSSSYLKLSDFDDRLDRRSQELRVPVSSYYSYSSPNAKYSVTTPTELRTLHPVALSRSLVTKRN